MLGREGGKEEEPQSQFPFREEAETDRGLHKNSDMKIMSLAMFTVFVENMLLIIIAYYRIWIIFYHTSADFQSSYLGICAWLLYLASCVYKYTILKLDSPTDLVNSPTAHTLVLISASTLSLLRPGDGIHSEETAEIQNDRAASWNPAPLLFVNIERVFRRYAYARCCGIARWKDGGYDGAALYNAAGTASR